MTTPVEFFRSLADETRWRIIRLVMDRAMCVCELADILEMPQSSVSSHVQIIRKAGLLESEICGKWTYFRIVRCHLPFFQSVLAHLADPVPDPADALRAEQRLSRRAASCCPGPIHLAN